MMATVRVVIVRVAMVSSGRYLPGSLPNILDALLSLIVRERGVISTPTYRWESRVSKKESRSHRVVKLVPSQARP